MERLQGKIYRAVIYKEITVCYALADSGEFFKISEYQMEKIPREKNVPRTPINPDGYSFVRIEDGQRISFDSAKRYKGKNRWARNIKLLDLGKIS